MSANPLDSYHLVTVLVHGNDAQMFTFPAHFPSGEACFVHGTGLNLMDCADDQIRANVLKDTGTALARYIAELLEAKNG